MKMKSLVKMQQVSILRLQRFTGFRTASILLLKNSLVLVIIQMVFLLFLRKFYRKYLWIKCLQTAQTFHNK